MDWLNENSQRAYPFTDGGTMDGYPQVIVDAVFGLGEDIPFDFDNDTAEIRLVSVATSGADKILVFQYFADGVASGPTLTFTVPTVSQRHTVVRANSTYSHGYLTIGSLLGIPDGSYGAALEARVVTLIPASAAVGVSVYNAERRGSYVPFAPLTPGLTPAQLYTQAKAAAPPWTANTVLSPPVGSLSGIVYITGGFNIAVAPQISLDTIELSMFLDGPGSGCGIRGYVQSKLGSSDPVANISGSGTVNAADVLLADAMAVAPVSLTVQGILRTLNGVPADNGNLTLYPGDGVEIDTSQDAYAILLTLKTLSLPTKCV